MVSLDMDTINITLSTDIYQNSTHTNRYLYYMSHRSKRQKLTVAKTLIHKVGTVVSNKNHLQRKWLKIRSIFRVSGFPAELLIISRFKPKSHELVVCNITFDLVFVMQLWCIPTSFPLNVYDLAST